TLVIAEHHLEPWLPHVDRLVVLGPQARIIADGDPASVLRAQHDRLREAGVLPAGPAAPPATRPGTGRQAAAATASLHRVTVPPPACPLRSTSSSAPAGSPPSPAPPAQARPPCCARCSETPIPPPAQRCGRSRPGSPPSPRIPSTPSSPPP